MAWLRIEWCSQPSPLLRKAFSFPEYRYIFKLKRKNDLAFMFWDECQIIFLQRNRFPGLSIF